MTQVLIGAQKNYGMMFYSSKKAVSHLTFEQRMFHSLKRKGLAAQFERAGVYGILLDGKLVYIGKSGNML